MKLDEKIAIIVEDEEDWQKTISESLDILNITTEIYSDYNSIEKRLSSDPDYHLLILDLNLNYPFLPTAMEGFEIGKFVNFIKKIPIIIVTGNEDDYFMNKAFNELNIIAYHYKSTFSTITFINSVRNAFHEVEKEVAPSEIQMNKFIDRIVDKINSIYNDYHKDLKDDLHLVIEMILQSNEDQVLLLDTLVEAMNEIKEIDQESLSILVSLDKLEQDPNLYENKVKFIISIIPGILQIEPKMDLNACLKKLGKTYDTVSFKAYEKLANLYFSLLDRKNLKGKSS